MNAYYKYFIFLTICTTLVFLDLFSTQLSVIVYFMAHRFLFMAYEYEFDTLYEYVNFDALNFSISTWMVLCIPYMYIIPLYIICMHQVYIILGNVPSTCRCNIFIFFVIWTDRWIVFRFDWRRVLIVLLIAWDSLLCVNTKGNIVLPILIFTHCCFIVVNIRLGSECKCWIVVCFYFVVVIKYPLKLFRQRLVLGFSWICMDDGFEFWNFLKKFKCLLIRWWVEKCLNNRLYVYNAGFFLLLKTGNLLKKCLK